MRKSFIRDNFTSSKKKQADRAASCCFNQLLAMQSTHPTGRCLHPAGMYPRKRSRLQINILVILKYCLAELNSTILDSKNILNYSWAKAASSPMKLFNHNNAQAAF